MDDEHEPHPDLNERQLEVLRLVAHGCTTREIALQTNYAVRTITKMLSTEDTSVSIYNKIGVRNRKQATAWYASRYPIDINSAHQYDVLSQRALEHIEFTEHISERLAAAVRVRREGNAPLGRELVASLANELRSYNIYKLRPSAQTYIQRTLGLALFEEQWAAKETIPSNKTTVPSNAVSKITGPIIRDLHAIAKTIKDGELTALYHLAKADSYYLEEKYITAIGYLQDPSHIYLDRENALLRLRLLALCFSKQKEAEQVRMAAEEAHRTVGDGLSRPEHICELYEGIARARGLVNDQSAFRDLERSQELYKSFTKKHRREPLREVQICRSEVELLARFAPGEVRYREQLVSKGLQTAEYHGYFRIAQQIKSTRV